MASHDIPLYSIVFYHSFHCILLYCRCIVLSHFYPIVLSCPISSLNIILSYLRRCAALNKGDSGLVFVPQEMLRITLTCLGGCRPPWVGPRPLDPMDPMDPMDPTDPADPTDPDGMFSLG